MDADTLRLLLFLAGIALIIGIRSIIPFVGWIILLVAGLLFYPVVALSIAYAWRTLTAGRVTSQT